MKKSVFAIVVLVAVLATVFVSCAGEEPPRQNIQQEPPVQITYMSGDQVFQIQNVDSGTTAPTTGIPNKDGYDFIGWFADADCAEPFDFDTYFADPDKTNVTVYAGFREIEYTATQIVYMVDGEVFTRQEVAADTVSPIRGEPGKSGHRFIGWFADADCTEPFDFTAYFADPDKESVMVYAGFEVSGDAAVTLVYMADGRVYQTQTVTDGTNAPISGTPSKEGFTFTGWYKDADCAELFDFEAYFADPDKGNAMVYAGFAEQIHITYIADGSVFRIQDVADGTNSPIAVTPDKDGYTFTGWFTDADCTQPFDFDAYFADPNKESATVYAGFGRIVKIDYMADGEIYRTQTVGASTDSPITGEPLKQGYEFVGWFADESCEELFDFEAYFADPDKTSVTVYAGFKRMALITYIFDGQTYQTQYAGSDTNAPISDEPVKTGYEFIGWFADEDCGEPFDFDAYFASEDKRDVTVYAGFEAVEEGTVQISYVYDGRGFRTQTVGPDTNAPISEEPVKAGYTFTGWFADESCEELFDFEAYFADPDKTSVTVYAGFEPIVVQLVYKADGETFRTQDVDIDTADEISDIPTKAGYRFVGWYADEACRTPFDFAGYFAAADKDDVTVVYAGFEIVVVQLVYKVDGETFRTQDVDVNTTSAISAVPTKAGYEFTGWYADENCATLFDFAAYFADPDKTGVTVYAGFEPVVVQIVYMADGSVYRTQNVDVNTTSEILSVPIKSGYEFTGWYSDPDCTELFDFDAYFADAEKESVIVYAGFDIAVIQINYTVDGSIYRIQEVGADTSAPISGTPSRGVYEFTGWYEDAAAEKLFDFDAYFADPNKRSVTVYAGFALNAVHYDMDGDGLCDECGDPNLAKPDNSGLELYDYRVGYIAGDTANNTVELSAAIPGGSKYTVTGGSIASIVGTSLTANAPGEAKLQYRIADTEGNTIIKTVALHVLDGYTNVAGSWDALYSAIMVDKETANVCVQSEMVAPGKQSDGYYDSFIFIDYSFAGSREDYPAAGPSPNTLNLYGNALKWNTSAITSAGEGLFRIEWVGKTMNLTDLHLSGADVSGADVDPSQFEGYGAFFAANGSTGGVTPVFNINHCLTENAGQHYLVGSSDVNINGSIHRNSWDAVIKAGSNSDPGNTIDITNSVIANSCTAAIQFWGVDSTVNLNGFVDFHNWKNRANPQVVVDESLVSNSEIADKIQESGYDQYFAKENNSDNAADQYLNLIAMRIKNDSSISGGSALGIQEVEVSMRKFFITTTAYLYVLEAGRASFGSGTWCDPHATVYDNAALNYELVHGRS